MSFTGIKTDKRGRRRRYVGGKLVPLDAAEHAGTKEHLRKSPVLLRAARRVFTAARNTAYRVMDVAVRSGVAWEDVLLTAHDYSKLSAAKHIDPIAQAMGLSANDAAVIISRTLSYIYAKLRAKIAGSRGKAIMDADWEALAGLVGELVRETMEAFGISDPEVDEADIATTLQERLAGREKGDRLRGGMADDVPEGAFDPNQLAIGMEVEMEHTDDRSLAREIARDHLTEDPDYYRKLRTMEKGWTGQATRTGGVKAVGNAEHAGRTLYGDAARRALAQSGKKAGEEGGKKRAGKAAPAGKPKAAKPEPGKPVAKPTVEDTVAHVEGMRKEFTTEGLLELAQRLQGHTVAELGEIKRRLGLKASGPKAELARKIAQRALADQEQPKEPEAAKPKREPKAKPEPAALTADQEERVDQAKRAWDGAGNIARPTSEFNDDLRLIAGLSYPELQALAERTRFGHLTNLPESRLRKQLLQLVIDRNGMAQRVYIAGSGDREEDDRKKRAMEKYKDEPQISAEQAIAEARKKKTAPKAQPAPARPSAGAVKLSDPKALADAVHAASGQLRDVYGYQHDEVPDGATVHKVLISELYDNLKGQGKLGDATLDDFKAALLRAHQSGALSLSRLDMPQILESQGDRLKENRRSEIGHMNATFQLVSVPDASVGKRTEQPAAAPDHATRLRDALEKSKDPKAYSEADASAEVERLSKLSHGELKQLVRAAGIQGLPASASKTAILARIRDRLTAAHRVQREIQV